MSRSLSIHNVLPLLLFLAAGAILPLNAQTTGTIKGTVKDPSAAVVPNAAIQIAGPGQARTDKTDSQGQFTENLPAGDYTLTITAPGFVTATEKVTVASGQASPLDVALEIATTANQVNVTAGQTATVDVDPSQNAAAIVLTEADMDSLPDDPDDLQDQLTAMAGPAAGPNGPQIFIDGFSGGQMPPKSSIREIRINSNPFASEFDSPGFGRIQIFTKPGTDAYHASAFLIYGNHNLDTRDPFVTGPMPDYGNKQLEGSLSGPLGKKLSWFLTASNRDFDTAQLINGQILDPSTLSPISFNSTFPTPSKAWQVNPRIDYAINTNNTLVLRYYHNSNTS
ncbi:MAG TPA: carboxypeptidase-like regulatory domain-containing protein, partial [Bryobacteraceae bacterium]